MRADEYLLKLSFDQNVTISTGVSVSSIANSRGQSVVGLIIPSTFSGTSLTLVSSTSSTGTFYDMKNSSGDLLTITFNGQGWYQLNPTDLTSTQFVKFVSNTTQSGSDCEITLITRALA